MSVRRANSQAPTTPTSTSGSRDPSFPPPPSSYRPSTSTGTADSLSAPIRSLRNRLSRNFEDALKDEDTVQLSAGTLDESRLGVVFTPPVSRTATSSIVGTPNSVMASPSMGRSRPLVQLQPATPTVVPPTPYPNGSPADPSQVNNSFDTSVDQSTTAPIDNSTKRRSLLRSAGTASSPDLATLVRKAKERGGIIGAGNSKLGPQDQSDAYPSASSSSGQHAPSAFLSPNASNPRTRATSSTSSFSIIVQPEASPAPPIGPPQTLRSSASAKKLTKHTASGYTHLAPDRNPSPSRVVSGGTTSGKEMNKVR